jgi:hypothetical protein
LQCTPLESNTERSLGTTRPSPIDLHRCRPGGRHPNSESHPASRDNLRCCWRCTGPPKLRFRRRSRAPRAALRRYRLPCPARSRASLLGCFRKDSPLRKRIGPTHTLPRSMPRNLRRRRNLRPRPFAGRTRRRRNHFQRIPPRRMRTLSRPAPHRSLRRSSTHRGLRRRCQDRYGYRKLRVQSRQYQR